MDHTAHVVPVVHQDEESDDNQRNLLLNQGIGSLERGFPETETVGREGRAQTDSERIESCERYQQTDLMEAIEAHLS